MLQGDFEFRQDWGHERQGSSIGQPWTADDNRLLQVLDGFRARSTAPLVDSGSLCLECDGA